MEYQPLRYRLSSHGLTRDYQRIDLVNRYPRVNRPVVQGSSRMQRNVCRQGLSRENRQLFGENALTYFALPTRTPRTIASIGPAVLPLKHRTSYHLRRDAFRQI